MAESIIQVTSGSGPKVHTWQRTVGANSVEDEFYLPGEYPLPSYTAIGGSISIATTNDHILQLMSGSSTYTRIRRIRMEQAANATTATVLSVSVLRLTTAGTGGATVTPAKFDTGDGASGATAMTLPTAKGTETTEVVRTVFAVRQAVSTTAANFDDFFEWVQQPGQKPIIIPSGTANGIAIKNLSAIAGASMTVTIEFVETSFL